MCEYFLRLPRVAAKLQTRSMQIASSDIMKCSMPAILDLKTAKNPIISVQEGQLRGKISKNYFRSEYYSFQGVPYAKPPTGELRFKAPQPAEPWVGIRDATKEGNMCYHQMFREYAGAEDCLYLNVYTPQLSEKAALKPVMVWIHGGGFQFGSGNTDFYDPNFLMIHDVVVVTINYRYGLLGFLNLEDPALDVPGNAGLKDQVLALKWVQRNIRKFGGDPNNVTIFGQSAGGASVHHMMMSPMAKGLFHKAIIQSATALDSWARGQPSAPLLSKALKLDTKDEKSYLDVLNRMTVEEVFKVQEQIPDGELQSSLRPFGIVVEDPSNKRAFLTEEPVDLIKSGKFSDVPLMIGYTSWEGLFSGIRFKSKYGKMTVHNDFKRVIPYMLKSPENKNQLEELAQIIKKFYYGNEDPSLDNISQHYMLETDTYILSSICYAIKLHLATSLSPLYFYRMSLDSQLNIYKKLGKLSHCGTSHGDDLGYLFKNVFTPKIRPGSIEDEGIKKVTKLWTTFAKYGDPNPTAKDPLINVTWKPVEEDQLHYLDIGENVTAGINPDASRIAFWENLYQQNVAASK